MDSQNNNTVSKGAAAAVISVLGIIILGIVIFIFYMFFGGNAIDSDRNNINYRDRLIGDWIRIDGVVIHYNFNDDGNFSYLMALALDDFFGYDGEWNISYNRLILDIFSSTIVSTGRVGSAMAAGIPRDNPQIVYTIRFISDSEFHILQEDEDIVFIRVENNSDLQSDDLISYNDNHLLFGVWSIYSGPDSLRPVEPQTILDEHGFEFVIGVSTETGEVNPRFYEIIFYEDGSFVERHYIGALFPSLEATPRFDFGTFELIGSVLTMIYPTGESSVKFGILDTVTLHIEFDEDDINRFSRFFINNDGSISHFGETFKRLP